ncbi:TonB-dependent receptor [Rhodanobacter sp. A1T4]|uniref:TonB-dependent receptor n=1 Tax=Rhodanobacter sp. A1T4 TaxID=2723087 RepID=UPI00160C7014|nr:TonB-dependent receptor [Rhodanobacter sp. A1T4]MBB6249224.1 outer membrane receptor protein involved in Fe transport [Rhodanobacter sp. A1T4]
MKTNTLRHAVSIAMLVAATGTAEPTRAQKAAADTSPAPRAAVTGSPIDTDIDLPAGTLAAALDALGKQSELRMDYPPALVEGKQSRAVHGRMSWRDALGRLLQGSGLVYRQAGDTRIVIVRVPDSAASAPRSAANDAATTASTATPAAAQLATVTVTGTRIRGGSTPSPVVSIGSEQIQQEGFSDLGEVIRSVPQNFSGGQNPGVLSGNLAGAGNANQNLTGGSSLNLRGLGADATLTLLNGRRMTYGGFTQAVDISAIPVEAVDRIEIVADGASAIYGSDAVGGVGNVILKRDYDGVTVGSRFGTATQGGMTTREYNATAGTTWSTGGLIATYKDASVDPIYSSQRSYTSQLVDPATLYPGSDLRSGLLSVHQSLGDFAELRLDALSTTRDQLFSYNYKGVVSRATPHTTTTLISPSLEFWLPGDWSLTLSATSGQSEHHEYLVQTITASGAAALTDACYCNTSHSYELGAEGPLFALPGGDARLAAGIGYRDNGFRDVDHVTAADTFRGSEGTRFAYAEFNLPLIGADQPVRGVQRLDVTAAVRGEDYSTFGGVTTPKLGLLYDPNMDFTLKASWGKSFKAPTLFEQNYAQNAYLFSPSSFGGVGYPAGATVLVLDGGNKQLTPERADTRSVSLAFHPEALRELEAELSWFRIDYRDRVIQPIANSSQALNNPIYAPFVDTAPTAQVQADVLANAETLYNYVGAPYDPSKVAAIIYTQYANTAQQRIQGVDLSGSYRFQLGQGALTLRGATSWLDSSQQTVAGGPAYALSGTLFNPPKISSRVGADWKREGFTASLFANYRSGVTNRIDGIKSASFTTFDAALRYAIGPRDDALSGLEFALTLENLLDRDPPLYRVTSPLYVAAYDSTNYSPIGRFVSVSVSKHW